MYFYSHHTVLHLSYSLQLTVNQYRILGNLRNRYLTLFQKFFNTLLNFKICTLMLFSMSNRWLRLYRKKIKFDDLKKQMLDVLKKTPGNPSESSNNANINNNNSHQYQQQPPPQAPSHAGNSNNMSDAERDKLRKFEQENQQLIQDKQVMQKKFGQLAESNNHMIDTLKAIESEQQDLLHKLEALSQENAALSQNKGSQSKELEQELNELREKNVQLELGNNQLQFQIHDLEELNKKLSQQLQQLNKEQKSTGNDKDRLIESQINKLKAELENRDVLQQQIQQELDLSMKSQDSLKRANSDLQKENQKINLENKNLNQKILDIEAHSKEEIQKFQGPKPIHSDMEEKFKSQINELEEQLLLAKKNVEQKEKLYQTSLTQIQQLQSSIEQLETQKSNELPKVDPSQTSMQDSTLNDKIKLLVVEIDQLQDQNFKKSQNLASANVKIDDLNQKIVELKKDKEIYMKLIDEIQRSKGSLDDSRYTDEQNRSHSNHNTIRNSYNPNPKIPIITIQEPPNKTNQDMPISLGQYQKLARIKLTQQEEEQQLQHSSINNNSNNNELKIPMPDNSLRRPNFQREGLGTPKSTKNQLSNYSNNLYSSNPKAPPNQNLEDLRVSRVQGTRSVTPGPGSRFFPTDFNNEETSKNMPHFLQNKHNINSKTPQIDNSNLNILTFSSSNIVTPSKLSVKYEKDPKSLQNSVAISTYTSNDQSSIFQALSKADGTLESEQHKQQRESPSLSTYLRGDMQRSRTPMQNSRYRNEEFESQSTKQQMTLNNYLQQSMSNNDYRIDRSSVTSNLTTAFHNNSGYKDDNSSNATMTVDFENNSFFIDQNQFKDNKKPADQLAILIYPYHQPNDYYKNKSVQKEESGSLIQYDSELFQSMRFDNQSHFLRFQKASLSDKGIFFQNEVIKVGSVSSYSFFQNQYFLKLSVYILNQTKYNIQITGWKFDQNEGKQEYSKTNFLTLFFFLLLDLSLWCMPEQLQAQIKPDEKSKQELVIDILTSPYSLLKGKVEFQYRETKYEASTLFPVTINQFMNFQVGNAQIFKSKWSSIQFFSLRSQEISYDKEIMKNSSYIHKYFQDLIELNPFKQEEHNEGIADYQLGGFFQFFQYELSQFLLRIKVKPFNQIVFQVGSATQPQMDHKDQMICQFLINTLTFLFKQ